MFYRSFYYSLLSSVLILGSSQSLIAMDGVESPSLQESTRFASPVAMVRDITAEDRQNFAAIMSVTNPFPETHAMYDAIDLSAPLAAILPMSVYEALKDGETSVTIPTSTRLFVGILANGIKVFMKRAKIDYSEVYAKEFVAESVAPKIARAFFNKPTLPKTFLERIDETKWESRQYFIEGEEDSDSDSDSDDNLMFEEAKKIWTTPEVFNREPGFGFDLNVFNIYLVASIDRNLSNQFYVPSTDGKNNFISIDYEDILDGPHGCIKTLDNIRREKIVYDSRLENCSEDEEEIEGAAASPTGSDAASEGTVLHTAFKYCAYELPAFSPALIAKFQEVSENYPSFFEDAKPLLPDFPWEDYFQSMKAHHEEFLQYAQKNITDEG